ncbi:hypothetical protein ACN27F_03310 [Solwaraspora sp. WMMB335]
MRVEDDSDVDAGEALISLGLRSMPPAVEFVVRIRLAVTRQS